MSSKAAPSVVVPPAAAAAAAAAAALAVSTTTSATATAASGAPTAASAASPSPPASVSDDARSVTPTEDADAFSPRELSFDSSSMMGSHSLQQTPGSSASLSGVPQLAESMPAFLPSGVASLLGPSPTTTQRGRKRRANSMDATGPGSAQSEGSLAAAAIAASFVERQPGKCKRCNCKNSRCLKLYCECFASKTYCSGCSCIACANRVTHKEEVERAVRSTLERNPAAFQPKIEGITEAAQDTVPSTPGGNVARHTRGCHCRRTGCLKGYCECFQAGVHCGPACKCVDCKNFEGSMALRAIDGAQEVHYASRKTGSRTSAPSALTSGNVGSPAVPVGSPAPPPATRQRRSISANTAIAQTSSGRKPKPASLSRVLSGFLNPGSISEMAQGLFRNAAAVGATPGAQELTVMHEFAAFLGRTANAVEASASAAGGHPSLS